MTRNREMLALSFLAVFVSVSAGYAQGLAPEGPVAVTFTATEIPPAKRMPIGDGREFAVVIRAMAASNDAGSPILNNMGGRCQFSLLVDTSAKDRRATWLLYLRGQGWRSNFRAMRLRARCPKWLQTDRRHRKIRRSSGFPDHHRRVGERHVRWHRSNRRTQKGHLQDRQDPIISDEMHAWAQGPLRVPY
jgi:hypothetical protein